MSPCCCPRAEAVTDLSIPSATEVSAVSGVTPTPEAPPRHDGPAQHDGRHRIPLGPARFTMGSDDEWAYPTDAEYARPGETDAYEIDVYAVTNLDWARFVDSTGYVSTAERIGTSQVFAGLLPDDHPDTLGVAHTPWWRIVPGACWSRPEGERSDLRDRWDHPVVHISWIDALAFTSAIGVRLPTEAEWEYAARDGTTTVFPWGDTLEPDGVHMANVFQGTFPVTDTGSDGWVGTCPVDVFEPNSFGLANMIGNVWEWTADRAPGDDGPILKGGSYLCHASYCRRYRPAARIAAGPDTTAGNIGFRTAK